MLCKIGNVEVWRLLEMNDPFMSPESLFPNAGPKVAQVIEAAAPGSVDAASGKLIIPVQGFVLKSPEAVMLVDACVGNHKNNGYGGWAQRDDGRFMAGLAAAGTVPEEVDIVVLTHLHPDHVGWNTRLEDGAWVPSFPNARYLLPGADVEMHEAHPNPMFAESVRPVLHAGQAEQITAPCQVSEAIDLIATPGHSPGHCSVRIRSDGQELVLIGDALHMTAQIAHPEWQFKFDEDPAQAVASRQSLLQAVSASGARVIGSHFQLPSIGRVEAVEGGFRWCPD